MVCNVYWSARGLLQACHRNKSTIPGVHSGLAFREALARVMKTRPRDNAIMILTLSYTLKVQTDPKSFQKVTKICQTDLKPYHNYLKHAKISQNHAKVSQNHPKVTKICRQMTGSHHKVIQICQIYPNFPDINQTDQSHPQVTKIVQTDPKPSQRYQNMKNSTKAMTMSSKYDKLSQSHSDVTWKCQTTN